MSGLDLRLLDAELVVARLAPDAGLPPGIAPGAAGILSVTSTAAETSVVCDPAVAPAGARLSPGWRALVVDGVLDHGLIGILASLATPLAAAGVPIFALSTFDTDYVLVPAARAGDAAEALRGAGHRVATGGD